MHPPQTLRLSDYRLIGTDSQLAVENGLADAHWYVSPVPKEQLRDLLTRKDGPGLRDCAIYFSLIVGCAYATILLWGSAWALLPMMMYGVLYASASDARWHESSHGTAFKTDFLNHLLYEIASFMVMRESIPWRWSHTRHHSDTIIVGRDPEIAVPRPPNLRVMLLKCINFQAFRRYVKNISLHSFGKVTAEEATYLPPSEYPKVFFRARIYAGIFVVMAASCLYFQTWFPFIFILGPNLYGAWLMPIYGWTQHAGLAENVLDHRLNCRTIHMNFINRFLYWNMNYHLEHHMFPLVPYHQLPKLHELIKDDCPPPYRSLASAYREMIPTVLRQIKDPGYFVKRKLPSTARPVGVAQTAASVQSSRRSDSEGWIHVCDSALIQRSDVIRFDHEKHTYAVYRTENDTFHATDGICTHGNTHLADGLVVGKIVECPKHNGRFDITDGSPKRLPVCVALKTYPVKVEAGLIWINIATPGGKGLCETTHSLRVVSNQNLATYIKELVLEPIGDGPLPRYQPGQYMQLDIPAYPEIQFRQFDVAEPFATSWKAHHVTDFKAHSPHKVRRNYSIATHPGSAENQLRFNIRIATPPRGLDCSAGVGSSYLYALKPGDVVSGVGPFGDFLIRENEREMVYVGGGAGMAPLRSHLAHLFETLQTNRRVTFWYGARSKQEIFYESYFRELEARFPNFTYRVALSEPQVEDDWSGHSGFIHEVLKKELLSQHPAVDAIDYYLCGPPMMIQATQQMLTNEFSIPQDRISYDEF